MKKIVMLIAVLMVPLSSQAGSPKCNGILNCNEVEITDESVNNDAVSNSRSRSNSDATGVGIGVGTGGDARATGGDSRSSSGVYGSGNSSNYNSNRAYGGDGGEGGDARAHQGQGQGQQQGQQQGQVGIQDTSVSTGVDTTVGTDVGVDASSAVGVSSADSVDVAVEGDTYSSSSSFNYEEASRTAATLLVGVCQDGTSVQGVKFGFSNATQSTFCKYTTLAQLQFSASASMECGADDHDCRGDKEFLREDAVRHLNAAAILVAKQDSTGLFKALFNLFW